MELTVKTSDNYKIIIERGCIDKIGAYSKKNYSIKAVKLLL